MKRVITYGTFDLLHYGHINLLKRAKALGDYLIVALSTDEFNWNEKNKKCYFSYEERKALLESLRYVDLVIPENNWEQKRTDVKDFFIDTFVIGDDWSGKFDFLKEEGVEVVYLPRTPEISTTQIKNDLNHGNNNEKSKIYKAPENFVFDPEQRMDVKSEFAELIDKYELELPSKSVNDHYYDGKIDENSILVVGLGVNVRGNMQYILNELNSNEKYAQYKIYVRTKPDTDDIVKQYIERNNWKRTKTVVKGYNKKIESCKYMITESYFPYAWVKKEQQVVVELWHGTPLKKLGLEKNGPKCHLSAMGQIFLNSDYVLCPNEYTRDRLMDAAKVESLMNGQALMLGYPRNGGLLAVSPQRTQEIRELLAPNGERVYAYMPTFRGYLSNKADANQKKKLMDYLDKNLQDDQILYVNLHHKIGDNIDYSNYRHIRKFPPLIDSYELMTATDALITDYSSVFIDYMVLEKQIILFVEDYDEYEKHQGLYFDLRKLPFDIAETKKSVLEALNRGKQYDDTKARQYFCGYDTPESAKKICEIMVSEEGSMSTEEFHKNNKKKIMAYTYCGHEGKATTLLHEFTKQYDKNEYELFLSCESAETNKPENLSSAYPMMAETPVIGSNYNPNLSSMGQVVKQLYIDNKLSFDKAMELLKYDYVLMPKRMYGGAKFDAVMIYDVAEPEVVLGLSLMETEYKLLFLQDEVFERISKGDSFLKDALRYASQYCNGIYVSSTEHISEAEALLDSYWSGKIQVVKEPDDLNKILESIEKR